MNGIKNVVIIGGGTAGWLSAIAFTKLYNLNVTLIESTNIPTIGVGESTQPGVTAFLNSCGYKPTDWMPYTSSTYKLGVMFEDWSDHKFLVDSENAVFNILNITEYNAWGMNDAHMALNLSPKEINECLTPYRLAINNKSPKFSKHRFSYHDQTNKPVNHAVQWNNVKIQEFLKKESIKNGLTYIQDNVSNVILDSDDFISEIKLSSGKEITGDIFLDCTGFNSVLFKKTYDINWVHLDNILPNNNGVVIRKNYTNPQEECHPYTNAKTMKAGWRWSIPTYDDISHGYVYSDRYIDKDAAEQELRESINEWDQPALHVPFNAGIRNKIAHKNAYAIGITAGFIEPLEATGLAYTTSILALLLEELEKNNFILSKHANNNINSRIEPKSVELIHFIFTHFYACNRQDTLYWQDIKTREVPESLKKFINVFLEPLSLIKFQHLMKTIGYDLTRDQPMFLQGHWWQLLQGCNWYKDYKQDYDEDFITYSKLILEMQTSKTNKFLEMFPNHYDFLTEWYKSC